MDQRIFPILLYEFVGAGVNINVGGYGHEETNWHFPKAIPPRSLFSTKLRNLPFRDRTCSASIRIESWRVGCWGMFSHGGRNERQHLGKA